MGDFLSISTVFKEPSDRNLVFLESLYGDPTRLAEIIKSLFHDNILNQFVKDKKVLIKPNWVTHSAKSSDETCLRTHDNFILAVLEIILEAGPTEILIADAPIQGCQWDQMVSSCFVNNINELSRQYKIPVKIKDFRRRRYQIYSNDPVSDINPIDDYLIFDLEKESSLEVLSILDGPRFRVTNYNPDRMKYAHASGTHKYCIARDFFEADVVISLPKVKTHQKTGITCSLKNLVGINGDKDFLPHHRLGGTERGGDCYPGGSYIRYLAELALDEANRRQGKKSFWIWQKLSSLLWLSSLPGPEHQIAAGWHGNDTTWRMVKDLNLIAYFGRSDGSLANKIQRKVFTLCDGIIAGQGDGPLEPEPLPLGIVSFSDNPVANDIAMVTLMGYDYTKFPLLVETAKLFPPEYCSLLLNAKCIDLEVLKNYSIYTKPPKGWKSHLTEELK